VQRLTRHIHLTNVGPAQQRAVAADYILFERDGPIATIVLNRPEKLNALTRPMWQRLGEVARGVESMDDVRCVILRGAGEKAFSPGNDIGEFATERSNKAQARDYGATMHATAHALARSGVPRIPATWAARSSATQHMSFDDT